MSRFAVGSPYHPDVRRWPDGVAQYNYRSGAHELAIFLSSPSDAEIAAVRGGACEFAVAVHPPVIAFCYRFAHADESGDGIPWSDAPFSVHRLPPAERTPPPARQSAEDRALLQVFLVDSRDGILRAMRQVSFGPEFTARLHESIADQASMRHDPAAFDAALERLYATYATAEDLARRADFRTAGGA